MQSSRIQSKITFTTDREFREYCETHDMRPDTEWEISSTGQRGRGPAGSPARKPENSGGKKPAEKTILVTQGEGWTNRIDAILSHHVDAKIKAVLDQEREQFPDIVQGRIDKVLGLAEDAIQSGETVRRFGEALKKLKAVKNYNKEQRRSALLKVLALPESERGHFTECHAIGRFSPDKIRQMEETFGFLHCQVREDILERTRVKIFAVSGKHITKYTGCGQEIMPILDKFGEIKELKGIDYDENGVICYSKNPENRIYIEENDAKEDRSALAHEIGHAIENANPDIRRIANSFYEERTKGEGKVRINSAWQKLYDDKSVNMGSGLCRKDHFLDPYCGYLKDLYDVQSNKIYHKVGSEIMSVGLELLFGDPEMFFESDPEYFRMIVHCLQTKPSQK